MKSIQSLSFKEQHAAIKAALLPLCTTVPLFALLDLANTSDASVWHQQLQQHGGYCLFDGTPESTAQTEAPWLIQLDWDDALLDKTITAALLSDCCSWIRSDLPPHELARRLSTRLDVQLEEQMALLRFYDPRIFPELVEVLEPAIKSDFLAFGHLYLWLGRDGCLSKQILHPSNVMGDTDPLKSPFALSDAQQSPLLQMAEWDQMLFQLNDLFNKHAPAMSRGERFNFIKEQCHQANQQDVNLFMDQLDYCELVISKECPLIK